MTSSENMFYARPRIFERCLDNEVLDIAAISSGASTQEIASTYRDELACNIRDVYGKQEHTGVHERRCSARV